MTPDNDTGSVRRNSSAFSDAFTDGPVHEGQEFPAGAGQLVEEHASTVVARESDIGGRGGAVVETRSTD